MLVLDWMEKLIISGKIIIDYVDLGFYCKIFFVLGMFRTFI